MGITDRAAAAIGGPRGGTTWFDEGMANQVGFTKTATTVASTTLEEVAFVIQAPNTIVMASPSSSVAYQEVVGGVSNTTEPIQGVYGVYVTPTANWGANIANLTVQAMLRRAGSVIGGGAFAGWAAASNAALTAWIPTFMPWITGNTALASGPTGTIAATAGGAFLPVRAQDVITIQFVTTGSVTLPSLLQVTLTLV